MVASTFSSTYADTSPTYGRRRLIAVRLMIGFLLALGALAITPVLSQAAPQGPWLLPATDLSASGEEVDDPQIAAGSDGTATAVWQRYDGSNYIIQAATRPPGGSFAPTVDISVAGEDAYYPQVAVGPDGTATAVWERYDGSNYIIQAATRPPGGSFGTPVNLSGGVNSQVAVGPDGTATAVWERDDGSNTIIQAATRPPGGPFADPNQLSVAGRSAFSPQIAVGPDGTATAVWRRSDGTNQIIQAATRPPGGSFAEAVQLSVAGEDADDPQVAVGPDGTATAVWERYDGSNTIIQAATRPPGGSFGTPVDLSAIGENADLPRIATGPDGTATAVWERYDGSNDIIQSASTEAPAFSLNVEKSGDGVGTVISAPAGIECGSACTGDYISYARVTLTANPNAGSTFTGFSGGRCSGPGTTCEVTMDRAHTVTAFFAADPVVVEPPVVEPPVVEPPACPPEQIDKRGLKKNKKKGIAKLKVTGGGAGKIILKGSKNNRKFSKKVSSSGKGTLKIQAKGKAAKKLKKRGKVKFKVKYTYKPGSGCPAKTKSTTVKLVRKK